MGIYGLTATSSDVKSAGHNREAMVGQNVAQQSLLLTAETFSPSRAQGIINGMYGPNRTSDCKTSRKYTAGTVTKTNNAEACTRLTPTRLQALASGSVPAVPVGTGAGYIFQTDSFGKDNAGNPLTLQPNVEIEITNPMSVPMPGFQVSSDQSGSPPKQFASLTVTVFTEMKEPNMPPAMNVLGRGRIVAGPASLDEFR
jgi:hypothetical protein